jgi:protein CpxP
MKTLRTTLLTGLAALSLGGAMMGAQAQNHPRADGGGKPQLTQEERQAKRAEFGARHEQMRAERIAKLHDELRITPAQENAWNSFVASMKPTQRAGAGHLDRAAFASLPAPQRMEKMIAMQKARTAAMEQRLGALGSFYSVLSPEQKKVFDEKAARMQGHRGGHGGRHGGWQQRGDAARG